MPVSRATLAGSGGNPHDHPEYAPTAHTHPPDDVSDQIDARVAEVIDAAPATLDTLNELAAALGDDANFAATITTELAGKATAGHTHPLDPHSHADNEIPASIARDAEVTAAIATHAATPHGGDHPHPYASDTHNHDSAYSGTDHVHEPAAPAAHSHVDGDLPADLARDSEVAAAYSPLGHTHSVPTHSHVDGDLPAGLARDSEVAAAYSPLGHTHAGAPDARIQTFTKATDQAVTGTAVVDVTGLAFPVEANATYVFSMWVDITASGGTSPTHNYQFTGPAGIDRFMAKRTQMTSATAQATTVVTALATGFGAGATVANIKQIFEGTIKTGATAGTVQLRVTPAGTAPTSTIARGSGGFATKVS